MSKEKQNSQENSLENFTWDNAGGGDFFGIPGTAVSTKEKAGNMQSIIDEVTADDDGEEVTTKVDTTKEKGKGKGKAAKKEEEEDEVDEEEEEENDSFFEDEEEEDNEETEDEEGEEDEDKKPKDKKEKVKPKEVKDKPKGKKNNENQTDGQFFKTLAVELKEYGVFQNVELPEDKEELT